MNNNYLILQANNYEEVTVNEVRKTVAIVLTSTVLLAGCTTDKKKLKI